MGPSPVYDLDETDKVPGTSKSHSKKNSKLSNGDNDSGYGGSVISGSDSGIRQNPVDLASGQATYSEGSLSFNDSGKKGKHHRSPSVLTRRHAVSQVNQLQYNDNRVALGRSISAVLSMLKELQSVNRNWPVFYPAQPNKDDRKKKRHSIIESTKAERNDPARQLKRAVSDIGLRPNEEKVGPEPSPPVIEPRLVSAQIAQDFNVFKLDFKLGALSSEELVHTLTKSSVASLLDDKIIQTMRHLLALR